MRLTEKQHLDFVPLAHLILFQLGFDFLISRLSLLVLCALCATHFGNSDLFEGTEDQNSRI